MDMGGTQAVGHRQAVIRTLAGLAADDSGESDDRPPLVLLHGLTFDRSMWRPSLDELQRIDPGRRVLTLDLPGHGASRGWPSYDVASVARGVFRAVEEAELDSPVVVGHSISGVIATFYAAQYPTRGVINVDQPLQIAPFADLVQSLAGQLRGPGFPGAWQMFAASMHVELLPDAGQELVRSSCRPRQDLVLGYWREVLDRPAASSPTWSRLRSPRYAAPECRITSPPVTTCRPATGSGSPRCSRRPPSRCGREAATSRTSLIPAGSLRASPRADRAGATRRSSRRL